MKKLKLYLNTIKYLKLKQFITRAKFIIKKKLLYKSRTYSNRLYKKSDDLFIQQLEYPVNLLTTQEQVLPVIDEERISTSQGFIKITMKDFEFLNHNIKFDDALGWNDPEIPQLWRYNLHYFDYFKNVIEQEILNPSNENYEILKYYVTSWVENNDEIGQGDGWHPYTISLRLVNWILTYSKFHVYIEQDIQFKNLFLKSIIQQSQFLLKNLEYDVYGNHLFENLKSLIVTGLFLGDSDLGKKCLEVGERELKKELKEQFLNDGGHFELSLMYHSILLKGISELLYIYKMADKLPFVDLINTEKKAYTFLINMIHPDNEIPLFNDAAFGIAKSPDYLMNFVSFNKSNLDRLDLFDRYIITVNDDRDIGKQTIEKESTYFAEQTGYLKSSDSKILTVYDFGKACPDYLPAHAHADMFSYELSFGGRRVVVDTGTYQYEGSEVRDYDRSTFQHNTLTLNRENQSNVWGSFRVAERAFPTLIKFEEKDQSISILASHNGYKKRFSATHKRKFIHIEEKMIVVLDTVESNHQLPNVESFIHFHPETDIINNENTNTNTNDFFINNGLKLKLLNAEGKISGSKYHPEFGMELENSKLTLSPVKKDSQIVQFGYLFSYTDEEIEIDYDQSQMKIKCGISEWNYSLS